MVKTKKFVLKKAFNGEPKLSDFELVEEDLPDVIDGEVLCEAIWLSVDPYMRAYSFRLKNGATMIGSQVARIVQSKHKDYKAGDHVIGHFGWKTHTVCNPDDVPSFSVSKQKLLKIPSHLGDLSLSHYLGAAGMPGNTAYFGLLEICLPKPGEVVVVSGAAGAVGHLVGQIAKIKGCKVIGFTGSDEKVRWLVDDLKFDAAFNYKNKDISAALKEAAPEGVDCYFDNVGGPISSAVLYAMRKWGRIAVCGSVSTYNADLSAIPPAPSIQSAFIAKELKMEGFVVTRWIDRWLEGIQQNINWMKESKIKVREQIVEGFEQMPKAFIGMLKGENVGKAVVRA